MHNVREKTLRNQRQLEVAGIAVVVGHCVIYGTNSEDERPEAIRNSS
jgi:hypothetical protein